MKNGPTLNKGKEGSILGLWARMGVAADEAMEGANKITLASYLLDFVIVCLGKFVSCQSSRICKGG